jgi:hypothetical protein
VRPVHAIASARRPRAAGRIALLLALVTLAAFAAACRARAPRTEGSPVSRPPLAEVLARHTPPFMAMPGVVGTYQGADSTGQPVFVVMIAHEDPALAARIPPTLEGWPVRVEVTGELRALGDSAR